MSGFTKPDEGTARLRILYQEEHDEFKFDFDASDADGDGCISSDEIRGMLKLQLEREPTEQEVQAIMAEFDANQDSKISFQEYMDVMCGEGWEIDEPPKREKALKFMVPVDGSNIAKQAYHYAARLLQKGEGSNGETWQDELIVYHVTNPGRYPD